MKEKLGKAAKTFDIVDEAITGVLIVLGIIALLARAIYLAWK